MQANDPVVDDLLKALFRVVARINQTVQADTVERAAMIILTQLKADGPVRLSDLANALMLDISTVSRQVRALEDRGMLTRSEDAADRRAVRLELAPAGLAVIGAAWARRHDWLAQSLTDWTPRERAELSAMLTRFADALHAGPAPTRPQTETPA